MRYTLRSRGRPKYIKEEKDYGTQELQFKRMHSLTTEMLDLILYKGLITKDQHKAGMHLRWLYTLKYGAPNISAYDHTYLGGRNLVNQNEKWLAQRNQEYENSILKLTSINAKKIVTNICIFDVKPKFLNLSKNKTINHLAKDYEQTFYELLQFKEGLKLLSKYYLELQRNIIFR